MEKCAGEEDLTLICTRILDLNNSTMASSKDTITRVAAGADLVKADTRVDQAMTMTDTTHKQEEVEDSTEAHL
jgi:hypothetical protein